MSEYRITFRIMGLCCLVKGDVPFQLVDSFDAFETQDGQPDLIFELHQAKTVDLSGYRLQKSFKGDLYYQIYENDGEWLKLCHNSKNPSSLRWCVRHRTDEPNRYVYLIFPEYEPNLKSFDPFLFLGLPKFLIDHSALLLHASVVCCEGQGILFTAPSGTGKSTQADLWANYHQAEILNGDRALIRHENGNYRVYGSHYAGSSYIYKDKSAPIRAIIILRQASENRISLPDRKEMFLSLLSQFLLFREDSCVMNAQIDEITALMEQVPIYLLECRPDRESSDLLYDFLKESD